MRFILFFIPLLLTAQMLKVGDEIMPMTIVDQFDSPHDIGKERVWIITWDKMTTRHANDFLAKRSADEKKKSRALIVDVSQTPSGILQMFVLPRMRAYEHSILLSYDAQYNITLPYKEAHITVLFLDDGKIERIGFVEDEHGLARILRP